MLITKCINGFEGLYKISNTGVIIALPRKRKGRSKIIDEFPGRAAFHRICRPSEGIRAFLSEAGAAPQGRETDPADSKEREIGCSQSPDSGGHIAARFSRSRNLL